MTDVITALRDVNPRLQESFAGLNGPLAKAISLIKDADSCHGDEARKALGAAACVEVRKARVAYDDCARLLGELDAAEKSYTRKFESDPHGPKGVQNRSSPAVTEKYDESTPDETDPE